jgi:hypothetical protein
MATDKVIGGDYEGYQITSMLGQISLSKGFSSVPLNKQNVDRVEIMTEESKKKFLGAAGLGIAGGLLLGPLGLVAGALAGGNKKEVCFACYLKDGKKFMAVTDSKLYQKIAALAF